MKVWELPSGREVFQLTNTCPTVGFTQDGRWLILASDNVFQCLETGTWRSAAPGSLEHTDVWAHALSADSRWVAVEQGRRGRLVLRELPTLQPLLVWDTAGGLPLCFSPDNSLLLTRRPRGGFGIWDLRRIREELTEIGLAW